MEMWEDNIIKTKLEGMDTLPEGYAPNLESKWSMLEAGLDGNRKQKGFVWKPYAAAAMLLMLGGPAILLMRPKPKTAADIPLSIPSIVTEKVPESREQIVAVPGKTFKHKVSTKKNMIEPVVTIVAVENLEPETSVTQVNKFEPEQLIAHTPKTKKPRFVEVDFNDAPITAQKPSESVIAAQQFKFRIGINSVSSGNQTGTGGSLRIQQSF
jgi:hypothetical protein